MPVLESPRAVSEQSIPELRPRPPMGLGAQLIGAEEESLILDVVRRQEPFRYYGSDAGNPPPMAARLEQEFAAMMGAKYALAVTSGTAALEVALGALGIGPGDEVIIPVWSWVSCFTSVVRLGALPVLAEIDETFCLAPGEIARLSTPRTKAVMIVHYQGVAAEMDTLLEEATAAGIKVIEDCAESPGALYKGRRVGTLGDIGTYSFQFNKTITSGEGGMVVTDDPLLFERAVRMHDLGNVRPHFRSSIEPQLAAFCGSQFRMTELQAALALAQLRKLDGIRAHCRALQSRILEQIEDVLAASPEIELRSIPDPEGDSGFEIYLCLPDKETAAAFRERLDALNVNSMKTTGTYCHYAQEYCRLGRAHAPSASPFARFAEWPAPGYREEDFPRTRDLADRFVAIPLGVLYTADDADHIARCIRAVARQ
jgi:8-amino-3,8-dideoxy-alpha-D-manno-octulosonate transaminase